uniref:Uncharacterized protein n=2 Tax=Anguilla anguilla TaxID=7936 RepID=A0A0E9VLD9_ANGAN
MGRLKFTMALPAVSIHSLKKGFYGLTPWGNRFLVTYGTLNGACEKCESSQIEPF